MQPSTFRFSCMPVSRVECVLQLPSLDIVFSSKRVEEELTEFRECKERFDNRWSIRHGLSRRFFRIYISSLRWWKEIRPQGVSVATIVGQRKKRFAQHKRRIYQISFIAKSQIKFSE